MQLGMIGLGRMGGNIVRRLMKNGHTAVVYDKDTKAVAALAAEGAVGAADPSLLLYPLYFCAVNGAIAVLIAQRRARVAAV